MKFKLLIASSAACALLISGCSSSTNHNKMNHDNMDNHTMGKLEMPFGAKKDIAYSQQLWENMESSGLNSKSANLYVGGPPHGKVREVIEGKINGKRVIVKRNYGGKGVSVKSVSKNRAKYLKAITVMAKRDKGYDTENADWFWVKYKADGTLHSNPKGVKLAGKIAKGASKGCISCHASASGTNLVFKHSNNINADIVFVKDFVN